MHRSTTGLWSGTPFAAAVFAATVAQAQTPRPAEPAVLESKAPSLPAARAWRVDPRPTLLLGDPAAKTEGDSLYEFSRVMGLARLASGQWVVALPTELRFFDAAGRHLRTSGRNGDGPGELRQVMGLRILRGDTLLLTDRGEVEYFAADGKFVGQGASRRSSPYFAYPLGAFSDGSYAGYVYSYTGAPAALEGRQLQKLPLVRVSRAGDRIDTLAIVAMSEVVGTGRAGMEQPVTYAPYGLVAAHGDRLFYSFSSSAEITEFAQDGRRVRLMRLDLKPRAVTSADQDDYRKWLVDMPGEDGRPVPQRLRDQRERVVTTAGFASTFPVHNQMLADRSGNIWLRRFDVRHTRYKPGLVRTLTIDRASTWDVIDRAGRWLTSLETPARFTPLDIGTDYLAGIAHNADDVEMIAVYRLIKP
jgi:hypothetical protein